MMPPYRPIDWLAWLPEDLYRVGDDGSVWRWVRARDEWKRIKPEIIRGSAFARIQAGGRRRRIPVGVLVLRAFVGPRPIGCLALHYPDRDKLNNRLENLRWAPRGAQRFDAPGRDVAAEARRGSDAPNAVLDEAKVAEIFCLRGEGWTVRDIADELEVTFSCVWTAIRRRNWRHVAVADHLVGLPKVVVRGSRHANAQLCEADIPAIVRAREEGKTLKEIALQFNVSISTIDRVVRRITWRHVDLPSEAPP